MRAARRLTSLVIAAVAASGLGVGFAAPAEAVACVGPCFPFWGWLTVNGPTNGATYQSSAVPAATCTISGMPSSPPFIFDGPSVGGTHTETAECINFMAWNIIAVVTYTVIEVPAPSVSVPADFSVAATSAAGAVVDYVVSGVGVQSCDHSSNSTFPIGKTAVYCGYRNAAGYVVGEFDVTVTDPSKVTVTVPKKVAAYAKSAKLGANASFVVTASDTFDGALTVTCNHASGSHFSVGATKVTCTATNTRGRSSSASFPVVVSVRAA